MTGLTHNSFDLDIRGKRILTSAGIVPREVGRRGGVLTAIQSLGNNLQGQRRQSRGHRRIHHPIVEARQKTHLVSHVRGHRSQSTGNVRSCQLN